MKKTLTYHNAIKADFDTLFLQNNLDLLIDDLRTKTHDLVGKRFAVDVLVPRREWLHHNFGDQDILLNQFNQYLKPRLSEVFGNVAINLNYSQHLKGDDVSLAWGRSFTRTGANSIYLNKQKLLCYDDETLLDDGILRHFGFTPDSPFSLIIKQNHLSLYRHQGDYQISGRSLINTVTQQAFNFEIIKEV